MRRLTEQLDEASEKKRAAETALVAERRRTAARTKRRCATRRVAVGAWCLAEVAGGGRRSLEIGRDRRRPMPLFCGLVRAAHGAMWIGNGSPGALPRETSGVEWLGDKIGHFADRPRAAATRHTYRGTPSAARRPFRGGAEASSRPSGGGRTPLTLGGSALNSLHWRSIGRSLARSRPMLDIVDKNRANLTRARPNLGRLLSWTDFGRNRDNVSLDRRN